MKVKKILSLLIISLISISVLGCSNIRENKVKSNSTKYKIYEIKDVEFYIPGNNGKENGCS